MNKKNNYKTIATIAFVGGLSLLPMPWGADEAKAQNLTNFAQEDFFAVPNDTPAFSQDSGVSNFNLDTGFYIGFTGEAVFFTKSTNPENIHDSKLAPGVAFDLGYRGESFSVNAGFTYFFNNFFGGRDLLLQGAAHYIWNLPLGQDSAFSITVGGGVAHNFLGTYLDQYIEVFKRVENAIGTVRNIDPNDPRSLLNVQIPTIAVRERKEAYFIAIPDFGMQIAWGGINFGVASKFYLPIKKPFEVGYGISGIVNFVF